MKFLTAALKCPATISTVLVLPLIVLELIFNRVTVENAAGLALLFGLLWLLPTTGATVLLHISRINRSRGSTLGSAFGVVILVVVMAVWSLILIDQAPCFVGTPNCD